MLSLVAVGVEDHGARRVHRVGPDCHVWVGKALYSVPWRHIGRHVDARESERVVEVFVDGVVVKTWASRVQQGGVTNGVERQREKETPWS